MERQKQMMMLAAAVAAISVAHPAAASGPTRRRHLSFKKIAGYEPASPVADYCAVDLDQKAIEGLLSLNTEESFEAARRVYAEGGHSRSYATLTLATPPAERILKGAEAIGTSSEGGMVVGKVYNDIFGGGSSVKILYSNSDGDPKCRVGGLVWTYGVVDTETGGCFAATGEVTIDGASYQYSYDLVSDNNNGRTIQSFSTMAQYQMWDGCQGCPYRDYQMFYDYYGSHSYADDWLTNAFEGGATNFASGNADLSVFGLKGRAEFIRRSTVTMNAFMYVIRLFEDALDDCRRDCLDCNEDTFHSWDAAVCLYVGSLEGSDGAGEGKMLYALADKMCVKFKTCGAGGNETEGTSSVNLRLMDLFTVGQMHLLGGDCSSARDTVEEITQLMYVPLVQGLLRYSRMMDTEDGDEIDGGEKEDAAEAAFAASTLPRINAASAEAAATVYDSMGVGPGSTDSAAVKGAVESVYSAMGITCSDVGGMWNGFDGYVAGAEPCVGDSAGGGDTATSEGPSPRPSGEPSGRHSSLPSSRHSGQPSSRPSGEPSSSQPSSPPSPQPSSKSSTLIVAEDNSHTPTLTPTPKPSTLRPSQSAIPTGVLLASKDFASPPTSPSEQSTVGTINSTAVSSGGNLTASLDDGMAQNVEENASDEVRPSAEPTGPSPMGTTQPTSGVTDSTTDEELNGSSGYAMFPPRLDGLMISVIVLLFVGFR